MRNKKGGPRLLNTSKMRVRDSESGSSKIQKNSVFEARVKGLADTGNAVVEHPDGLLFFVVGAWLGEKVRVRVHSLKSRFGIGELIEVLEPSPDRVTPPCPHQGCGSNACGGCSWMFIAYGAQLQAKEDRVRQAIGRIDAQCKIPSILAAENPLGYRVRAQFKTSGSALGFVANGERQLVAIEDCLVLTELNRSTLSALISKLPCKQWAPSSRKHSWTTLDIDEQVTAETVSVNQRSVFQQANAQQNQVMKIWLRQTLEGLNRQAQVLELFSGSGNFTQVISEAGFTDIVAVEVVDSAVAELQAKKLEGVQAISSNLFDEEAFRGLIKAHNKVEVLVLDPPRDGLKVKEGLFNKRSKIRDVIYISCDLATLCRDLREFTDNGFRLVEVQSLDLMPQTPHVEMLCYLTKTKKCQ